MDATGAAIAKAEKGSSRQASAPAQETSPPESDNWTPFEIWNVVKSEGRTLIFGRPDQQLDGISFGVASDVQTARGMPAFIRAQPERRGIIDFTTLSNLEPIDLDAYLDCSEFGEVQAWEAAIQGSPSHQNAVGWRLSFGRDRKRRISATEFTRPNWQGGMHWLLLAASGGHFSALNNLASKQMMRECSIDETLQDDFRARLYACAIVLERSRESDSEGWEAARSEARSLATNYLSLSSFEP